MFTLRSLIMCLLLLVIQPMAMPSLMSATYTRPSTQVFSSANETARSTFDFVGTTVEIEKGSTVPSFSVLDFIQSIDFISVKSFMEGISPMAFVQSIDYEAIKLRAEDFNEKRQTYTNEISDAMNAKFELFNEKSEAFIFDVSDTVAPAFKAFNEKREVYTPELSTAMTARIELFIEKYGLGDVSPVTSLLAPASSPKYSDISSIAAAIFDKLESMAMKVYASPPPPPRSFGIELINTISLGYQQIYGKLKSLATQMFALPPPPPRSFQSIARDVFDTISQKLEPFTAEVFFAPPPPAPGSFQSIALELVDMYQDAVENLTSYSKGLIAPSSSVIRTIDMESGVIDAFVSLSAEYTRVYERLESSTKNLFARTQALALAAPSLDDIQALAIQQFKNLSVECQQMYENYELFTNSLLDPCPLFDYGIEEKGCIRGQPVSNTTDDASSIVVIDMIQNDSMFGQGTESILPPHRQDFNQSSTEGGDATFITELLINSTPMSNHHRLSQHHLLELHEHTTQA